MNSSAEHEKLDPCLPLPALFTPMRFATGILALLTTALGLWMFFGLNLHAGTKYPCEHAFYHGIDSPILAVELASSGEHLQRALNPACSDQVRPESPDYQQELTALQFKAASAIHRDTIADCFLIPLYASFIWFFASMFTVGQQGSLGWLRRVLTVVVPLTALADYVEDLGIFRALADGISDTIAQQISWPSRFKWTVLGLALLITAITLILSANALYSIATRRLFSIGYMASGGLIIAGVWRPPLIELGMKMFSMIVLFQIIGLLGPYVSRWLKPHPPTYEEDFCERKKAAHVDVAVHT